MCCARACLPHTLAQPVDGDETSRHRRADRRDAHDTEGCNIDGGEFGADAYDPGAQLRRQASQEAPGTGQRQWAYCALQIDAYTMRRTG